MNNKCEPYQKDLIMDSCRNNLLLVGVRSYLHVFVFIRMLTLEPFLYQNLCPYYLIGRMNYGGNRNFKFASGTSGHMTNGRSFGLFGERSIPGGYAFRSSLASVSPQMNCQHNEERRSMSSTTAVFWVKTDLLWGVISFTCKLRWTYCSSYNFCLLGPWASSKFKL